MEHARLQVELGRQELLREGQLVLSVQDSAGGAPVVHARVSMQATSAY